MRNEKKETQIEGSSFNLTRTFLRLTRGKQISKFLKSKMSKDLTQLN